MKKIIALGIIAIGLISLSLIPNKKLTVFINCTSLTNASNTLTKYQNWGYEFKDLKPITEIKHIGGNEYGYIFQNETTYILILQK